MAVKLRDYQIIRRDKALEILKTLGAVYFVMEPRTGKTKTTFSTVEHLQAKSATFICGLNFKDDIKSQHQESTANFHLNLWHYEQLSILLRDPDYYPDQVIIIDEGHNIGAFPLPSDRALLCKQLVERAIYKHGAENVKVIFLSGTPSPENYCQLYHQFNILPTNPFGGFNQFLNNCVKVTEQTIYMPKPQPPIKKKVYTADPKKIFFYINPYIVTCTQKDAGFTAEIEDIPVSIQMRPIINQSIFHISNHKSLTIGDHTIETNGPASLKTKIHQLSGGTIKLSEDEKLKDYIILDTTKAEYIKNNFQNKKIAIYYKFKAEFELLKQVFPKWTNQHKKYNESTDPELVFLKQFRSGREGTPLPTAEYLIAYNMDYAAVSYRQFRERHMYWERTTNGKVVFLFTKGGLEEYIYKRVIKKQTYTDEYFERDLSIFKNNNPNQISLF